MPMTAGASIGYTPQITNGTNATAGAYPFMVALVSPDAASNFDGQFCGGSLIASDWVLTAAHCAEGLNPADVEVLVGARDLSTGEGTLVPVDQVVVHPDYNDPLAMANDVAMLHLTEEQSVDTIEPASDATREAAGTRLRLTGWGGLTTDQDNPTFATILQQADMPVVADDVCETQIGELDHDTTVCAGAPLPGAIGGIDACQGDSGGPLFATLSNRWIQVGIVSWGPSCGNTLSAYTSVQSVRPFIDDTLAGIIPPAPDSVTRIAGVDRFDTAAQLATERFEPGVAAAYVVTGDFFADALAAAPAAASVASPVLLTHRDELPQSTIDALETLAPESIVVVGGEGVVSTAVRSQLATLTTGVVTVIAGQDRYETAALVSEVGFVDAEGLSVVIASGEHFFDALPGAALAASAPASPLLLTTRDSLPATTAAELERLLAANVYVMGGTAAVSDAVVAEIEALGATVTRVAGVDRYDTSAQVASIFGGADEIIVATGTAFADGLVGSALGEPLLLVPAGSIPTSVSDAISALGATRALVLGGSNAVSDAQVDALTSLFGG